MSSQLRKKIHDFYDRARDRPAEAVGPELERLKQAADDDGRGDSYALVSPISPETWLQKMTMLATDEASTLDVMDIPYPGKIVGCKVEVLLISFGQTIVEPPIEAIDIALNIDRHENLTMRTDNTLSPTENANVVGLQSIDSLIANRSLVLKFLKTDQRMSAQVRWTVPLATVSDAGWGDVLVKLNWFYEPEGKGTGMAQGR